MPRFLDSMGRRPLNSTGQRIVGTGGPCCCAQYPIVIGGSFSLPGVSGPVNVAYWDGSQWLPFGAGQVGVTYDLDVYDGKIFRCGSSFSTSVHSWDGSSWNNISPDASPAVLSIAVFNGILAVIGTGVSTEGVYIYNGSTWQYIDKRSSSPEVYPDGVIYGYEGKMIASRNNSAIACEELLGASASNTPIAYNFMSSEWDWLGPCDSSFNSTVQDFATFSGYLLSTESTDLRAWDGLSWNLVSSGANNHIEVWNNELYSSGYSSSTSKVRKWNGSGWDNIDGGSMSGTQSTALFAGSQALFTANVSFGASTVTTLYAWNGTSWTQFGGNISGTINAFCEWPF